jgi:glycosyltransferase involved in cell wall biosynthesis
VTLRITGRTTVFSPHNLFSRSASRLDAWLIAQCARTAQHVVVYNTQDYETLRRSHRSVWLLPLVQVAPSVTLTTLNRWRDRLCEGTPSVAAIGQIRDDKNLPLLLEAATEIGVCVVVAGPDAGALSAAKRRAEELEANVLFFPGYHDLEDLGAVMTLIGVVVCPYGVASQSGVARLAASYGVVVVAADVGGLGQQADVLIEDLTPSALAAAIQTGLRLKRPPRDAPASLWSESERDLALTLLEALR